MLPVQCNAMRLVSKEENLKRQNYPKIHLTLPNSVQYPTSHQPMPPPYLPPPPTLPLTVSKLQDRKGSSILSITKENRKFRYFHFLISGGSWYVPRFTESLRLSESKRECQQTLRIYRGGKIGLWIDDDVTSMLSQSLLQSNKMKLVTEYKIILPRYCIL